MLFFNHFLLSSLFRTMKAFSEQKNWISGEECLKEYSKSKTDRCKVSNRYELWKIADKLLHSKIHFSSFVPKKYIFQRYFWGYFTVFSVKFFPLGSPNILFLAKKWRKTLYELKTVKQICFLRSYTSSFQAWMFLCLAHLICSVHEVSWFFVRSNFLLIQGPPFKGEASQYLYDLYSHERIWYIKLTSAKETEFLVHCSDKKCVGA